MTTLDTFKRLMECVEHAAAREEIRAATLRVEAQRANQRANLAHARECEVWAHTFREFLAQAKREIDT